MQSEGKKVSPYELPVIPGLKVPKTKVKKKGPTDKKKKEAKNKKGSEKEEKISTEKPQQKEDNEENKQEEAGAGVNEEEKEEEEEEGEDDDKETSDSDDSDDSDSDWDSEDSDEDSDEEEEKEKEEDDKPQEDDPGGQGGDQKPGEEDQNPPEDKDEDIKKKGEKSSRKKKRKKPKKPKEKWEDKMDDSPYNIPILAAAAAGKLKRARERARLMAMEKNKKIPEKKEEKEEPDKEEEKEDDKIEVEKEVTPPPPEVPEVEKEVTPPPPEVPVEVEKEVTPPPPEVPVEVEKEVTPPPPEVPKEVAPEKEKRVKKKKEITCILGDKLLAELNEMPEVIAELQIMLDQQRAEVAEFGDIVKVVDSAVADLELRHVGHSCQLVWQLSDFYRKFKEAKDKVKPIIFSPSFDTHPHGYRMALSLCPYGDGKFRGKFMSVFFCLLRGEHDALQTWPFSLPITISLISQAKDVQERVDHIATFTPHAVMENKVFLGRPVASRNPSLGFPKFIDLSELWEDEFVERNKIFIKVQVDTSEVIRV